MKFRSTSAKRGAGARSLAGCRTLMATAALVLLLIAGCSPPAPVRPDPKAVAGTYLAALKAGDYQACYRMLAEHDLLHGSLDEFLSAVPMAPNVDRQWFRQIEAATSYRVDAPRVTDDEAIIPVNVTTPNLVLWERTLAAHNTGKAAIAAAAGRQLYERSYPVINYPDQIVLVMEDDEWHVLAGFAQRARIAADHKQAMAAYHSYQYQKSLSLYRRILERLEKAAFTGSGGLIRRFGSEMKTVQAAKSRQEEAQAYLPKLALKDVAVKPAQSGGSGLFGKITNSGGLALDQVELTVTYYDLTGKAVFAERHTPIAIPLEFTDFDMPILPFEPGQTQDFGFTLKAPPQILAQNKPRVAASAVIFSQPPAAPPKLAGVQASAISRQATPSITPAATPAPTPSATPSPKPEATRARRRGRAHHRRYR